MKTITDNVNFLEFLGMQERQYIERVSYFVDAVKERLANGTRIFGDCLPWEKTQDLVRLRPGEVSLWAGINGHGKSLLLGQVLLWLPRDTRVLIASLEMTPEATITRMIRQTLSGGFPTEQYVDEFAEVTDNIFIYDQTDSIESNRILGMVHYAAKELGCKHIMIDSLMKCGISSHSKEGFDQQKQFVDRLCWAAKQHDVHIHLVHHIRKTETETKIPDKFDIKGAGDVTDLVDNVFIAWRNKVKERKIQKDDNVTEDDLSKPDEVLRVNKQRHGEWEGDFALYFHQESTQFVGHYGARPQRWRD